MSTRAITKAITDHVSTSRVSGIPYFYPNGKDDPAGRVSLMLIPAVQPFGDVFRAVMSEDDPFWREAIPTVGLAGVGAVPPRVVVAIRSAGKGRLIRTSSRIGFGALPGIPEVVAVRGFVESGQWPIMICLMPTESLPTGITLNTLVPVSLA